MQDTEEYTSGKIGVAGRSISYVVMILFTALTILPLIWLTYSSFKSNTEILRSPLAFPEHWTTFNYERVWKLSNMTTYMLNSVIYTGIATFFVTILSISTGFAFAKLRYRITTFFSWFILAGLLVSVQAVLVPLYIIWSEVGLYDTRLGIILPYVAFGLPFGIYLATAFARGIPDSLIEAAIIDGASYLKIFWKIILPVSRPVVTTLIILTALNAWNEFVFAFMLVGKDSLRSLSVGINSFAGTLNFNYGLQFAALAIGVFPTIIFYVIFHRQLMAGFSEGALKD